MSFKTRFHRSNVIFVWLPVGVLLAVSLACTRSAKVTPLPTVYDTLIPVTLPPMPVTPSATSIASATAITPALPTVTLNPADFPPLLAVVFLSQGELLNVRSGPGVTNDVVETLEAQATDLVPTENSQVVDGKTWVEIQRPSGGTGWASQAFLTEQVKKDAFCADPRVGELLDRFVEAVKNKDGPALSRLVSPVHGLRFQVNWWNPPVSLEDIQAISNLFSSTVEYDWGIGSGSGQSILGPFKEIVLPKLLDVTGAQHTRHCDTLEQGQASGATTAPVQWPYDYGNLHYVALYRPAPEGQEQNWRTWAVGIEYVKGQPYILVLVQYDWEI